MGSFHSIRASAAQPGKSRTLTPSQANPNAIFGWKVVRALQSPPQEIARIEPTDVTPERILSAIRGEAVVFPGMPVMQPRDEISIGEAERLRLAEERRIRIETELRRRKNGQGEREKGSVPGAFGRVGKEREY